MKNRKSKMSLLIKLTMLKRDSKVNLTKLKQILNNSTNEKTILTVNSSIIEIEKEIKSLIHSRRILFASIRLNSPSLVLEFYRDFYFFLKDGHFPVYYLDLNHKEIIDNPEYYCDSYHYRSQLLLQKYNIGFDESIIH